MIEGHVWTWDVLLAAEMMATTSVAALAAWLSYGHVRLSRQPNIVPSLDFVDENKIYLKLTNYGETAVDVRIKFTHLDGPAVEDLHLRCPVLLNGIDVLAGGHTLEEQVGTIDPVYLGSADSTAASDTTQEGHGIMIRYAVVIDWSLPGSAKRKGQDWKLLLDQGTVVRSTRRR